MLQNDGRSVETVITDHVVIVWPNIRRVDQIQGPDRCVLQPVRSNQIPTAHRFQVNLLLDANANFRPDVIIHRLPEDVNRHRLGMRVQ